MSLADKINTKKKYRKKVSFITLIDTYLKHRKKFNPFKAEIKRNDIIGFHPSGLYNACPRQIAFQFIEEKDLYKKTITTEFSHYETNPDMEMTWDFGHLIHFLIQYGYLLDYDKAAKVEQPITSLYNKYLISGTADVIVNLQDNKKYLGDIKTIRSEQFYRLESKYDVSEAYRTQLSLYMFGLKIPRGFICFINKNDSRKKEFFYTIEKDLLKKALQTTLHAKKFLKGGDTPILDECKKKKGKYKYCAYSSLCFQCKSGNDILRYVKMKNNFDIIKLKRA